MAWPDLAEERTKSTPFKAFREKPDSQLFGERSTTCKRSTRFAFR